MMLWFLIQHVQNMNFIKAQLTVLSCLIEITPAKTAIGLTLTIYKKFETIQSW